MQSKSMCARFLWSEGTDVKRSLHLLYRRSGFKQIYPGAGMSGGCLRKALADYPVPNGNCASNFLAQPLPELSECFSWAV